MKRILINTIYLIAIWQGGLHAQGTFPLNVSINLPFPYPTHLSDFTDIDTRVFINVTNNTSEYYLITLSGILENDARGIAILTDPSNPPLTPIPISPGINSLRQSDLIDLFDPSHLVTRGTTIEDIRRDEALPEGEYRLCLRAFDATNPGRALSPDPALLMTECANFNVSYPDPPEIIIPVNYQEISPTEPVIPIQWVLNRTPVAADITYTLRIVEEDPSGRDPNEVLLSSTTPELFFEEGIMETYYNLNVPDDAFFEPGKSYILQVIATDEMGEITFKNGGRSEPVIIDYREPLFMVGQPVWITDNERTFPPGSDVELEFEIPLSEGTSAHFNWDIYIFQIPAVLSPEEAYALGDFINQETMTDILQYEEPYRESYAVRADLSDGMTYGAKVVVSPTDESDELYYERNGESQILLFNYGGMAIIPRPQWITADGSGFDDPESAELVFRVQMPEGMEVPLDGSVNYFEIPEGTSAEAAALDEEALHTVRFASGRIFDDRPVDQSTIPSPDHLEAGNRYGAYVEIADPRDMAAEPYTFENNGRSEILTFSVGAAPGTDIVLTYPLEGDRIPFSFFPLIARYEPFNTAYQHWNSVCDLSKDGRPDDHFTGDGLRWPGGSQAAQSTLPGLSDITEDESQNIAVYKNNFQRTAPFDRGALYNWATDVKLYRDVEGTGPFEEFEKSSTFERGMGPSDLDQPGWGAVIAPDSNLNFRWITSEPPEQLLPPHRINHVTRERITYFNGYVKEKWVLEVSRSETFDDVIHHEEGTIGNGVVDYLSGDYTQEEILDSLYREIVSSSTFAPADTGYYYWRVIWLTDPDAEWTSDHYESSQVWPFWVGHSPPSELSSRTAPPEGCVSECLAPEITNTTPYTSLSAGSTITAGFFQMNVTEITGSSGNRFSGSGEIRVPFLNNVRVRVEFENIQINSALQLIDGEIEAANDIPSIYMDQNEVVIGGHPIQVPDMSDAESQALEAAITGTERLVSMLSDERPIGMPLGLDNEIDGVSYVIGITAMKFGPDKATLAAAMRLDVPSLGSHIPALGADDICFTPNGLGDEGRLYLHRDWTLTPDDADVRFSFSGCETGDTTRSTYVEWDCQGFRCMSIRGEVAFSTDMLVKEDGDGNIIEGERVTADFGAKTCRGGNWIADIGIEPFQVKGLNGWGFSSSRAYLDFSDIENPPSLVFPEAYDTDYLGIRNPTAASGGSEAESTGSAMTSAPASLRNAWRGFYLTEVMVHVPADFEDDVAGRPSFGIDNLIIDESGITGSILGRDIIDYEHGSIDNLAFSLDSVYVSIVQTSAVEGGLKGKLGLPIFEEDDYLNYEGLLVYRSDTFGLEFNVNVTDTLDVPMWVANMYLTPESVIGIRHGSGSEGTKTYVYTDLSGGIDIAGDLAGAGGSVPGVDFRGIRFEHIVYNSDGSQFDIGDFSFASPQKSAAGFPVNINDIGIDLSMPRVGLTFDLALTLSDAGFSAEAGFGVYAALDLTGDREYFRFDGVDLRSIEIDQQCSGVSLRGRLDFYNDDPTFGDGVRGYVEATLPMDIMGSLTVQFGTKKNNRAVNPAFNTRDYFPYWYVDGLIRIPGGVTIFSGFAIYGFGGGVYYRMRPDYSALTSTASMFGEPEGEMASGVRYIPDWETLGGFKIMAILGTQPSEEAFNMDVTIEMNFTASGGIGLFSIDGEGYVMASFENRPDAKIWATVHFAYVNPGDGSERVEGNFALFVDFGGILHGAGTGNQFVQAEFLVQDDIWYYYMGRQDEALRGGLVVDIPGLDGSLKSYLMIGHGIPRSLPPLPEFIASLVYGPGQRELNGGAVDPSNVTSREWSASDEMKMSTARGFAFGTSFHVNARFDFAIFYAELEAMFGFDILVNEDPARICIETGGSPGIHDWYAMGQLYAGLRGEMGVQVDLFFIKGEFPIIELAAAISLRGGFPNPTWAEGRAGLYYSILNGMVEGQCNFKVNVGDKCSVVDENPLSSIEFIADILPADSSSDVSVFVNPAVSFNLPVDKLLELPAGLEDEPDRVRVFRPFIERFTMTDEQNGRSDIPGSFELNETSTMANYVLADPEAFEADHRYSVEIAVRAYEYFPDGSVRLVEDEGRPWEDLKRVSFITGPRPRVLDEEVIDFTYPIVDQAYFLKGETNASGGIIKMARSQRYLFERNYEGDEYVYVARFKPVSGGDALESEIRAGAEGISFPLPDLDNEEYYSLQIVRKPYVSLEERVQESLGPMTTSASTVLQPIVRRFELAGSTVNVNLGSRLPGETVRSGETLLYHYYFRTSRFDNMREKLASLDFGAEHVLSLFEFIRLNGDIPEKFEEYDIYGYYKGGEQKLKPLVRFTAPFRYDYHTRTVYPRVYGLNLVLDQMRSRDAVLSSMPQARLNEHGKGLPPIRSVDYATSNDVDVPLQDWEIEREAGVSAASTAQTSGGGTPATGLSTGTVSVSSALPDAGLSGLFAGTTSNIFASGSFVSSLSGSTSRSYELELIYAMSNYVKFDAANMKNTLGRIISYQDAAGSYVYQNRLINQHPDEFSLIFDALRTEPSTFNYTGGTYGITIDYLAPDLESSGDDEMMYQKIKSSVSKTFNL